jgi:hypothetical protein
MSLRSHDLYKCIYVQLFVTVTVLMKYRFKKLYIQLPAEVGEVDKTVVCHLVCHIDDLLLRGIQTQGLHRVQNVLK